MTSISTYQQQDLRAYLLAEAPVGRLRIRLLGAVTASRRGAAVATAAEAAGAAPCEERRELDAGLP